MPQGSPLLGFVSLIAQSSLIGASPRLSRRFQPCQTQHIKMTASSAASSSATRAKVVQSGFEAAIEEYIAPGSNVAIGGGSDADVALLVEALSVSVAAGSLVDVAFVPVSESARAAEREFSLPGDLSVNPSDNIDIFIAPVSQMDQDLNTVICAGSRYMRTERYLSTAASKSIFVIHEADYAASSGGLSKFPIILDPLFPKQIARSLGTDSFLADLGVQDVVIRDQDKCVADVLLRPGADLLTIDSALVALPGIHAVGLMPATNRVSAVVTAEDQSYDITSSLARIAELAAAPDKLKPLTGQELPTRLKQLGPGWQLSTDGRDAISREFRFASPEQTSMFVSHVLRIARLANSFPEVTTIFNRVTIRLSTLELHGVTELDLSFAGEIGHVCDILHGCST